MRIKPIVLIALFAAGLSCSEKQGLVSDADKIKNTFISFSKACNEENFPAAKEYLAEMTDQTPDSYVQRRLQRYGKVIVKSDSIEGVNTVGDKGVLIYRESKPDLDPIFVVCENGRWKVLLPLTRYEHPCFKWSPDDLKEYAALEEWFSAYQLKDQESRESR